MKILVACEESQAVTIELRKLGHEAYSCDIIECSGGHPEWHIMQDVLQILNPGMQLQGLSHEYFGIKPFKTMDGLIHFIYGKWDMIIAHPPCTYLTVTGNRWLNCARYGAEAQLRWNNRCMAICFFLAIAYADCPKIVIENPVGCMSTYYRKPDQIIHPWQFALTDEEYTEKQTCLWLKGVSLLVPTVGTKPELTYHEWATAASKTFPGIARAMAEQLAGKAKEVTV